MLTRVYIDNFMSLVNFEYKPEAKQLLLGENGSGKSSLLRAIRYLKEFALGGENWFTQSTRTRFEVPRPFQILEMDAFIDGQAYKYRIEIRFDSKTNEPSVNLESLKVSGQAVFELSAGKIKFFSGDESPGIPFKNDKSSLRLAQLSNAHVRRFLDWLEYVHCFHIDPYPEKMDEVADREERWPDFEVENLTPWYRHLVQAYPEENIGFLDSMKEVLEGLQTLRFSSEEDGVRKLRAVFRTPGEATVTYAISELSEGQRCLMTLYMFLHFLMVKGCTIFIDEPENYLALREIQPWLLAAEEVVEDHGGQLVLVSHHPELFNQWAVSHGIRFFREKGGHVRTERFVSNYDGILQPSEVIARGWEK